jgi:NTE family protein
MSVLRRLGIAVVGVAVFAAVPARSAKRPTVGIALSGGAARGFAHVGVLKVLEEAGMPIDCVAGTSMGAVIGGLYAAGYSVTQLESVSVNVDWDDIFSDAIGRRMLAMAYKHWDSRYAMTLPIEGWRVKLPSGLIAGQKITKLLSRLTLPVQEIEYFAGLPTPFVCVATDIVNGEAVVLKRGNLAEAIRASMSVPTVFMPVVIDGRLLVDGGVTRNLPAQDARDLGADIVIGVDAAEPLYQEGELNSMIRIMDQAVHFQIAGTSRAQKRVCDILIVPHSDKMSFEFDQAAYFIERGEAAARAVLPRLQALADSVRALGEVEVRVKPEPVDSVYVTAVSIAGLHDIPRRIVESELMIKPPLWMSPDEIDHAVDQIYKYDYFERVGYAISPYASGDRLEMDVVESSRNMFRVGLRYDSETDLAALLNLTIRNFGVQGSSLSLDFRLGEDVGGEAWYFTPVGRTFRSFGLSGRINSSWRRLNVYNGDFREAVYRTAYTFGEVLAGNIFASSVTLEGGVRGEYIETRLDSGLNAFPDRSDTMVPAFASLRIDTFDRTVFPQSGLFVRLMAEATSTATGSDVALSRYHLDWRIRVPVHRTLSLFQALYLGTTPVGEAPPAYLFTIGGIHQPFTWLGPPNSFVGFEWQELVGPHAQVFGIGAQWECYQRLYATVRWNLGNVFERWNGDISWDDYENGGGVTLGLDVPAAPVEFTVSTSTLHGVLLYFTLGYTF